MPLGMLWSSGRGEIHGPVEALVFLLLMIGLGTWMAVAGFRTRRRAAVSTSATRGLDGMFGIFLLVVGTALAAVSLYLLIGGLAGVEGIRLG